MPLCNSWMIRRFHCVGSKCIHHCVSSRHSLKHEFLNNHESYVKFFYYMHDGNFLWCSFHPCREYHPEHVFSSMGTVMTLVIEEIDDIFPQLLSPVLAAVERENEVHSLFCPFLFKINFLCLNSKIAFCYNR